MEIDELPEELKCQIKDLSHFSQTIQCDVVDSLESANNLEEFRLSVENSMNNIIGEAQKVGKTFGTGQEQK